MFNNTIKTEASKEEKKTVQFKSTSHWLKKANIKIHSSVELHNNSTIFMQMVNLKSLKKKNKKNKKKTQEDQQQNASMMQEK